MSRGRSVQARHRIPNYKLSLIRAGSLEAPAAAHSAVQLVSTGIAITAAVSTSPFQFRRRPARTREFTEFRESWLTLRPFGNTQQDAQVLVAALLRETAPVVEHTRYNSSRKRRPLNQPATTQGCGKDPRN